MLGTRPTAELGALLGAPHLTPLGQRFLPQSALLGAGGIQGPWCQMLLRTWGWICSTHGKPWLGHPMPMPPNRASTPRYLVVGG